MVTDLSKVPKPAKEAKKATLAMMEGGDTLDLFDAKSIKGWWTMVEEAEDGTRNVKVSFNVINTLNIIKNLIRIFCKPRTILCTYSVITTERTLYIFKNHFLILLSKVVLVFVQREAIRNYLG